MGIIIFVVTVWATLTLYIGWNIMLDTAKFNGALLKLAAAVTSVAVAIRNPQVDNNSQNFVDAAAGRLEELAAGLEGLAAEETALDTADAIEAEPPAADPIVDEPSEGGEAVSGDEAAAGGEGDGAATGAVEDEGEGGQG